jgi:hypothetical protein
MIREIIREKAKGKEYREKKKEKNTRIKSIDNEIHSCFLLVFLNNQREYYHE